MLLENNPSASSLYLRCESGPSEKPANENPVSCFYDEAVTVVSSNEMQSPPPISPSREDDEAGSRCVRVRAGGRDDRGESENRGTRKGEIVQRLFECFRITDEMR